MIEVIQIQTNSPYDNLSYLIKFNNKAIVIDPFYPKQILDLLEEHKLILDSIISTHEHFDHICANEKLLEKTNAKLLAGNFAKDSIPNITQTLKEGDKIKLDSNSYLEVLETPGHIKGHICLILKNLSSPIAIFTGDTLFNAGVGNCRSGDPKVLFKSINKILENVEGKTRIHPGHNYWEKNLDFAKAIEKDNSDIDRFKKLYKEKRGEVLISNLEGELKVNPFLRLDSEELQNRFKAKNKEEIFLELRKLRDSF